MNYTGKPMMEPLNKLIVVYPEIDDVFGYLQRFNYIGGRIENIGLRIIGE